MGNERMNNDKNIIPEQSWEKLKEILIDSAREMCGTSKTANQRKQTINQIKIKNKW